MLILAALGVCVCVCVMWVILSMNPNYPIALTCFHLELNLVIWSALTFVLSYFEGNNIWPTVCVCFFPLPWSQSPEHSMWNRLVTLLVFFAYSQWNYCSGIYWICQIIEVIEGQLIWLVLPLLITEEPHP